MMDDAEAPVVLEPDHKEIVDALQGLYERNYRREPTEFSPETHAAAMRLINKLIFEVRGLQARIEELEAAAQYERDRLMD